MNIKRFIHKKFKPLIIEYYKIFHSNDISECLKIFSDYGEVNINVVIDILKTYDGWDEKRAINATMKCLYCGFITL